MALPAQPSGSTPEDVGRRIRKTIRAKLGERRVSVRWLAQELDMSESAVHARLNGGTRLSIEETAEIAALLGLTFDELVELSTNDRLVPTTGWYSDPAGLRAVPLSTEQMEMPFAEGERTLAAIPS